ncbi:sugar ABC transporter substrate-binding protein [Phycicoccus sp. Soil803]|uniref:sugar ABC transporter substrate-binding protein n=1 Tax=Phycicoccus sp. Soil803 TaxID=1736415 RepID=UPI000710206B|nr:sugar ABC transporter substrate-binding protein [Phycicoccus sp. Soil803]KRF23660.1 ABC transporter substrate-binding protein [Phycicoccus sp. Soil803]
MFSRSTVIKGAAVALAALALGACGRTASPAGGETPGKSLSSGPATGTVTVWAQGAEGAGLPALAKEFEAANPGVKVDVTAIPWDAAHNKYQTSIASGSTPDVAQMGTTWMGDFSDAFDPTPSGIDTTGFFPGSVKSTEVNGTAYGVPWYVDTRVLYYRKDLAAKAGFSAAPKTWDELKAMAKGMQTQAGAKWGIRLPAGGSDSFQGSLTFPWSNGAQMLNADGTKWTFDTPQWVDAYKYYQSFFTEGIANKTPTIGAGAAESAFVDGSVPMFIEGPAQIGSLNEAGGPGFDEKYAVAPLPKQTSATSFVGGSILTVFKKSKNRDAAWKFIQFLSKPDTQVKWQKATGDLPAAQAAWQDKALAGDVKLAVFGEQLKDTNSPPSLTTWTQVSAAADSVLEQMVKANLDPSAAFKTLQSKADSIGTGK